jgi:hypothetical protein
MEAHPRLGGRLRAILCVFHNVQLETQELGFQKVNVPKPWASSTDRRQPSFRC